MCNVEYTKVTDYNCNFAQNKPFVLVVQAVLLRRCVLTKKQEEHEFPPALISMVRWLIRDTGRLCFHFQLHDVLFLQTCRQLRVALPLHNAVSRG